MKPTPPVPQGPSVQTVNHLNVLTVTPFYPVEGNDAQGCFVAEPLPWLEQQGIRNTVVAGQPFYRGRVQTSNLAAPAYWSCYFSLPGGFGLPSSGRFLYSNIVSKIRKLNRKCAFDVIHAHAALPCGHTAALLSRELGIPFVVTVHGLDAFLTHQVRGLAGEWCRRTSVWVYRSARRVICISKRVEDQVTEGATANTTVIYNGVDPERFVPIREIGPTQVILCVANLIPIKGHELLLRAFAAVLPHFPEVSCEIIGEGPERDRLIHLANGLGIASRVRFLGRRSRKQVAEAMGKCTLFALPSRYEGLGCAYLEAMSSSKPVIACRGQGIEEVINHSSDGFLIEPDNLPAMTDALFRLLGDEHLRSRMGATARQTIVERYSFANQSARLARLYRECVA